MLIGTAILNCLYSPLSLWIGNSHASLKPVIQTKVDFVLVVDFSKQYFAPRVFTKIAQVLALQLLKIKLVKNRIHGLRYISYLGLEIVRKTLSLCTILPIFVIFLSTKIYAMQVQLIKNLDHNEELVLDCETALFITHPTSYFDDSFSSLQGVLKISRWMKNQQQNLGSFLLVDQFRVQKLLQVSSDNYYLGSECFDFTVDSFVGEHSVTIANNKRILLAGGYVNQCLLKTTTNLVDNWSVTSSQNIRLIFIVDAIYTDLKEGDRVLTLQDVIESHPEHFDNYISTYIGFLRNQLAAEDLDKNLSFQIYLGKKLVKIQDKGERVIEMRFVNSRSLKASE